METIIVEITIAATESTADYMLPAHVPVEVLMTELVQLVEQVYPEVTFKGQDPMICSMKDQAVIPAGVTLAQAGVRDGQRLLLV